jgi:acyl-CoA synthetase (AMP-forming)/AMP-acid ligase II
MTAQGNFGDVFRGHRGEDQALIDLSQPSRPRTWSYGTLNRSCDAVARGLVRRGLARGDRVAVLSFNRAEYAAVLFGAMRAGIVPVPINIKLPADAIAYVVRDCGAKLVFADAENLAACPAGVPLVDLDAAWAGFCDEGPFETAAVGPDEVALHLYTSGSTGRPKGVLLGHAGQIWNAAVLAQARRLDPSAAMMIAAPLYHKNALVAAKIAFTAGGRIVLLARFDARLYVEAIGRYRCTSLSGVPTMYALALAETELIQRTDLSSVRALSVGSAPASPALLEALRRAFPNAAVAANYGLTEGGPVPFGGHPQGRPRPPISIGYPLPGVEAKLIGGPGPDEGVLHLRNPGVMLGYHNLPAETAKRLRDGWFDTGDICRRDGDGFYYFVGRADDMFKCGGESVVPAEVEGLLERHPDVLQAAVVPVDNALKGQVPYAFVVARAGAAPGEAAIKDYALKHGPAYQHPRRVIFLDALPLAGTNKVDRKALMERAQAITGDGVGAATSLN